MNKSLLNSLKKRPLAHAIGFILAANTVSVFAQEAEVTDTVSVFAQEAEVTEEEQAVEEKIVITGSRIRSGGFDEARPVDIILADSAIGQGITQLLLQVLHRLPLHHLLLLFKTVVEVLRPFHYEVWELTEL
jgi:hypothetical protein